MGPTQAICKDPSRWTFFDNLSFSWMFRWMKRSAWEGLVYDRTLVPAARKGKVEVADLPLPEAQHAEACFDELNTAWETAAQEAKKAGQKPKLMKVLWKVYGRQLLLAGIFKLLWSVFVILGAYFFTRSILMTIRTLEGKEDSIFDAEWKGWILTAFFFIDAWLLGLMLQRMAYNCLKVGIRARAALTTMIARKCYNMAHLTKDTAAEAVGFVASDINKVFEGIQEIHYLWGAPVEAAAILALLGSLVGVYCIGGVIIVCCVVPLQYIFGYQIIRNKIKNGPNVTERWAVIQEILPAMKLVKYYAWERFFEKRVADMRGREKQLMFWNAVVKTINVTMVFGVPPLVLFAVLVPYELWHTDSTSLAPHVSPTTVFTMLSLFNILRFPLVVLPKAMRCVSEAIRATGNLQHFLAEPAAPRQDLEGKPGAQLSKAVLRHETDTSGFTLRVPEFSVKPGELVAVVGRVGSGKSSLLQALLGNMQTVEGTAHSGGSIAYVPQTAWCQNLSLKDNIVFGQPWDEARYKQVLDACALELDLQILAAGDETKAGLRGINLSGGQRQRLNVARAAYFGGDLVLLDNALSAVDHHTAHHIFDNCVRGMFRDKATVLVTHQVEFLSRCDKVCIMDEGRSVYFGPWNAAAQQLLSKYLPVSHVLAAGGNAEQPRDVKKAAKKADDKKSEIAASRARSVHSSSLPLKSALWEYCWDARWTIFVCSLFFFLTAQASRQLADYFVRWWTRDHYGKYGPGCLESGDDPCGPMYYVTWYGVLGLALFIGLMIPRGAFLYTWAMGASNRQHAKSIHRILYAPLGFFLNTPVGDLLVSFTKDQDVMDDALPDALYYAGIYGLILLATTITVSVTIPLFSAMAGALFLVSGIMLTLYLPAATHFKKLRMGTSGDVVTLVAEALDGLTVIQAYNKQQHFTTITSKYVDDAHRALFGAETLNLWLAFICDFFGACMVLSVACLGIGMWRSLGSSAVGLAFSQSIQMLVFYTWSIRLVAESIGLFGSVEKIAWLANHTPQEAGVLEPPTLPGGGGGDGKATKKRGTAGKTVPALKDDDWNMPPTGGPKLPAGWPRSGTLNFNQVVMKYAPHLPPALRGVSFNIKSGDKVGVVGRTGSGKSTLLLALYRMFNLESGAVTLDGVDISTLTLEQLRRGLSVIPQDPAIFSGTVRSNLDPFGEFGHDAVLWEALRDCGLEEQVKACGGLDAELSGTGGNAWSIGQAQLMCLARAALKKVPVLCLDEATAAMDPHTEAHVLEIIEKLFSDRTTLTIAHRLDNVIRSDLVVVMDAGEVQEMGHPTDLLANPSSAFSKLVDKTGAASATALRKMAADFQLERERGQQIGFRPRPSLDDMRTSLDQPAP